MARDIRVHFVGNAAALAASAAVDAVEVGALGTEVALAGDAADAASFELDPWPRRWS